MWNTIRKTIYIFWESQKDKSKRKGPKKIFKSIMAENFPKLGGVIDIQIHEVQRTPNRLNLKMATGRHIKLSKVKDKERNMKV